jgi:hypothetical protein
MRRDTALVRGAPADPIGIYLIAYAVTATDKEGRSREVGSDT